MKKTLYYKRSGERVSRAAIAKARDNYAEGKRTGKMGTLHCIVNLAVADRVAAMSVHEFATWSGMYTYRVIER